MLLNQIIERRLKMAVSNVTGFPAYIKVLDASAQDTDKNLSFVDNQTRISEAAIRKNAVEAENYVAIAQTKLEEQKKAILDENEALKAEKEALLAELVALKAAKQTIAEEPLAKTPAKK